MVKVLTQITPTYHLDCARYEPGPYFRPDCQQIRCQELNMHIKVPPTTLCQIRYISTFFQSFDVLLLTFMECWVSTKTIIARGCKAPKKYKRTWINKWGNNIEKKKHYSHGCLKPNKKETYNLTIWSWWLRI